MMGGADKINRLLDKNAAEQLARVDWDRLADQITARLDRAPRIKISQSGWPAFLKVAVGVAAAVAVILAAVVTLRTQGPSDVQVPEGRSALVELVGRQGTASIQISRPAGRPLVVVHAGHSDRKAAKCEVEIIDRYGDWARESSRAAWIIISKPQQTLADNGQSREEADVMCML